MNGGGDQHVDFYKTESVDGKPPAPAAKPDAAGLIAISDEAQYARGMYMIGQVAALHSDVMSIAQLHEEVSAGSQRLLEKLQTVEIVEPRRTEKPCDVAIVGMSCYFPKAPSLVAYWENVLNKVNVIIEVPPTHWDWRLYYNPDARAADKIISKWGGFLDDIPFDPLVYGITPNSLHSIEPLQLYLLEAVRHALADAGYSDRPFDRERTCAILGIGGSGTPMAVAYGFRTCLPLLDTVDGLGISGDEVLKKADKLLPSWTEDTFPGILASVAAGRVANRFNFGGANYAIDAACGSSLRICKPAFASSKLEPATWRWLWAPTQCRRRSPTWRSARRTRSRRVANAGHSTPPPTVSFSAKVWLRLSSSVSPTRNAMATKYTRSFAAWALPAMVVTRD